MKLKKEYFVLAAVMVALVLYLALHRSNRTHYKLPELPTITRNQISKLEITKAGNSVILNKKDNAWYIEPKGYPADSGKIKNMLKVIDRLKLTALVSESKNYVRYNLNSDKKIHVKAWQGKTLSREFDIGKEASTFQHTFVKLPGDPNVYHARGDFRRNFDRTVDDLRDMTVLSYTQKDIRFVKIAHGKKTLSLHQKEISSAVGKKKGKTAESPKPPATKTVWQNSKGKNVDTDKIRRLVSFLNHLECEKYLNDAKKANFKNPIYTVTLKGEKEYSLSIFAKKDKKGTAYPAISSENDFPFLLSDTQVDSLKSKFDGLLKVKKAK